MASRNGAVVGIAAAAAASYLVWRSMLSDETKHRVRHKVRASAHAVGDAARHVTARVVDRAGTALKHRARDLDAWT
jgi:hypothetical protein